MSSRGFNIVQFFQGKSKSKSKSKSKILYLFSGFSTVNTSLGLLSEITGN